MLASNDFFYYYFYERYEFRGSKHENVWIYFVSYRRVLIKVRNINIRIVYFHLTLLKVFCVCAFFH